MNIEHQPSNGNGRFVALENGQELGEMTYSGPQHDAITILHTEGFPGSEGKGVGMQLLTAAINFAREKYLKIRPLCPFVLKMMDRRKEDYTDVRA